MGCELRAVSETLRVRRMSSEPTTATVGITGCVNRKPLTPSENTQAAPRAVVIASCTAKRPARNDTRKTRQ